MTMSWAVVPCSTGRATGAADSPGPAPAPAADLVVPGVPEAPSEAPRGVDEADGPEDPGTAGLASGFAGGLGGGGGRKARHRIRMANASPKASSSRLLVSSGKEVLSCQFSVVSQNEFSAAL